jgi:hypothetical protein
MTKIYLDDVRPAPHGWVLVMTAREAKRRDRNSHGGQLSRAFSTLERAPPSSVAAAG